MNSKEWLRKKGIHPTEPIYWDFIHSTISLDELLEEYALYKQLQNTSSNSDYMKCLDDIWDIVSVNLRSGKWAKSEFGEILKKHFE